jgi:hypothetical protein
MHFAGHKFLAGKRPMHFAGHKFLAGKRPMHFAGHKFLAGRQLKHCACHEFLAGRQLVADAEKGRARTTSRSKSSRQSSKSTIGID